jgi:hypothetical protein
VLGAALSESPIGCCAPSRPNTRLAKLKTPVLAKLSSRIFDSTPTLFPFKLDLFEYFAPVLRRLSKQLLKQIDILTQDDYSIY